MAIIGALDKTKHLSEFNDPLPNTAGGYTTPSARKSAVRANIGVATAFTEHLTDVVFGEQPLVAYPAAASQNATGTLTATQILTGIITSTTAAAVSATLPLGSDLETALVAAYPTIGVNDSLEFSVINTGPNTFTILTNTGWTLIGSMAVATATSARFKIRRTATNVFVIYRLA